MWDIVFLSLLQNLTFQPSLFDLWDKSLASWNEISRCSSKYLYMITKNAGVVLESAQVAGLFIYYQVVFVLAGPGAKYEQKDTKELHGEFIDQVGLGGFGLREDDRRG